jgi:hypothetical protein
MHDTLNKPLSEEWLLREETVALVGAEWSALRPSRFNPGGKGSGYPLDRRLSGPQTWSAQCVEEKHFAPTEIRTPTNRPYSSYPVVIPTAQSRILNFVYRAFKRH